VEVYSTLAVRGDPEEVSGVLRFRVGNLDELYLPLHRGLGGLGEEVDQEESPPVIGRLLNDLDSGHDRPPQHLIRHEEVAIDDDAADLAADADRLAMRPVGRHLILADREGLDPFHVGSFVRHANPHTRKSAKQLEFHHDRTSWFSC